MELMEKEALHGILHTHAHLRQLLALNGSGSIPFLFFTLLNEKVLFPLTAQNTDAVVQDSEGPLTFFSFLCWFKKQLEVQ